MSKAKAFEFSNSAGVDSFADPVGEHTGEFAKLSVRVDRLKKHMRVLKTQGYRKTEVHRRTNSTTGDLESIYEVEFRNIHQMEQTAILTLQKQRLWRGDLEILEKLPIPSPETIDEFEKRFAETESSMRKHQEEIDELEQTLLQLNGQIEKLKLEREVPTEGDLSQARSGRETVGI